MTLSNGIAVMSTDFWRMASETGELMWCGEACVEDLLLGELDGDTICLQTGNIVNEKDNIPHCIHCPLISCHILELLAIACQILPRRLPGQAMSTRQRW